MQNFYSAIKKERVILIICSLIFIVSTAYAFYFRIRPTVDAGAYDQTAVNIVNGVGFRLHTDVSILKDDIITFQGPLYQYFLAGIYFIFGHNYWAVWIIQALLRALTALLLFLICRKVFAEGGKVIGWLAAIFFGFYPDLIEVGAMLMTETFFIFLLVLFLYIFSRYYGEVNFKSVFLMSSVFGAAILVRSSIGLFLPALLFYFYKQKAYKFLLLFIVLLAVVMTPWTVRNYLVYHKFLPTMANFGFNMWMGNRIDGDGEGGNTLEHARVLAEYGPIDANSYGFQKFKEFAGQYPLSYAKFIFTRMVKYFSFIRPAGFWFYQVGISQLIFVISSAMASMVIFTFGFAGIFSGIKKEKNNSRLMYLILFAFLTYFSVVPIIIETRYRFPIYPFMAIFAGFFLAKAISCKKYFFRNLASSLFVLLPISIIDLIWELPKIFEKLDQIFR